MKFILQALNLLGIFILTFLTIYMFAAVLIVLDAPRLLVVLLGLAIGFTMSRVLTKFMATKRK